MSHGESGGEARYYRGNCHTLPDGKSVQQLSGSAHSCSWASCFGSLRLGFLIGYIGTREFWVNQMSWWIWKYIFVRSALYTASRLRPNQGCLAVELVTCCDCLDSYHVCQYLVSTEMLAAKFLFSAPPCSFAWLVPTLPYRSSRKFPVSR